MYIHMCNCIDLVWIGQPDVNAQLVSREAPGSTILVQCTRVRHITGSAYERATHHWVGVRETSGREQRRERDISMQNVVRDNYVYGLCISCDLNSLGRQCL